MIFCLVLSPSFADEFSGLAARCAPEVAEDTLRAIVKTESAFNPYAIGVVGGQVRQPKSFVEAIQTVSQLEAEGKNYSVGLAQINKSNFEFLGINAAKALDACNNLKAASVILRQCFSIAKKQGKSEEDALHDALSCYYSGNFSTGWKKGYVNKVRQNAGLAKIRIPSLTGKEAGKTSEENKKNSLVVRNEKPRDGLVF